MTERTTKTATLGVRTGLALLRRIDELADHSGLTRSEVVRLALTRLDRDGIPTLDADMLRAARGME